MGIIAHIFEKEKKYFSQNPRLPSIIIRGGMEMERTDKSREVWQRVLNAQPAAPKGGLRDLRRESAMLAAAYRQLSGSLTGKAGEKAGQLYREETAVSACLRGLEVLRGEDSGKVKYPQPGKEPVLRLLRSCYHRTRNCMAEYTARAVDPETGAVFRVLADRAQRQCALLAELMGML